MKSSKYQNFSSSLNLLNFYFRIKFNQIKSQYKSFIFVKSMTKKSKTTQHLPKTPQNHLKSHVFLSKFPKRAN